MTFLKFLYDEKDDLQLWQEMKSGDQGAFDQIYTEHVDGLIRYGQRFTQDADIIDDSVQELFCRIWQKKEQLKPTDNIRYYLMAAFRKELLKGIKKAKRNSLMGRFFPESSLGFSASLETAMIQEESRTQQLKNLGQGFEKLSSRQKEIVYLKYYNEMSFDEIGQIMELDKKAVYNAMSKAMIVLRKEVHR